MSSNNRPNDDIMNIIITAFDDNATTALRESARQCLDAMGINPWDALDALRQYGPKR